MRKIWRPEDVADDTREYVRKRDAAVTGEVGSEAGETRVPADNQPTTIRRDETGEGRRSP
jgi:hypothetical protein